MLFKLSIKPSLSFVYSYTVVYIKLSHVFFYNDDEFGYRLWNLAEKKVIRGRDIVFMDEKTIVDWESEKKTTSSKSTDRDR